MTAPSATIAGITAVEFREAMGHFATGPDRISQLICLNAFVPGDGQALGDLIPPRRRPAMETLVQTEGFGWLLPPDGGTAMGTVRPRGIAGDR